MQLWPSCSATRRKASMQRAGIAVRMRKNGSIASSILRRNASCSVVRVGCFIAASLGWRVVQAEGLFEGERALDLFEKLAVLDAAGLAIEAVPVAGAVVTV